MTLGFSTKWPAHMVALANQPNYFVEKIFASVKAPFDVPKNELFNFSPSIYESCKPKLHTIRAGRRWKAGMLMHPVINNRTKNRFQFAPTMPCEAVQSIEIEYVVRKPHIYIDKQPFYWHTRRNTFGEADMLKLAINDGFESIDDFFAYFNKDFKGQIIHWTDLRY